MTDLAKPKESVHDGTASYSVGITKWKFHYLVTNLQNFSLLCNMNISALN